MSNFKDNFYEILGVSPDVTDNEIRDSFIRLSKKNHPDQGGSNLIMQMLNEAYDVLGDPAKRGEYDRWLKRGQGGTDPAAQASPTGTPYAQTSSSGSQPTDFRGKYAAGILKVTTPFGSASMPLICACCLQPYDKAVSFPIDAKTKKDTYVISKIKVPLCRACLKHVRKHRRIATVVTLAAAFVASSFQSTLYNLTGMNPYLAALPAIVLVLLPVYFIFVQKPPIQGDVHPTHDYPIRLFMNLKGKGQFSRFTFFNANYGSMFLGFNPGAVVEKHLTGEDEIRRFVLGDRFNLYMTRAIIFSVIFCLITGTSLKNQAKNPDNGSGRAPISTSTAAESEPTTFATEEPTTEETTTETTTVVTETTIPYETEAKPDTGLVNRYSKKSRVAPFTVKTSDDGVDYFVKLVNQETGDVDYEYYIHEGETLSVEVALGTYTLKYASGEIWYGTEHLFGPDTEYYEGGDDLRFYQSSTTIHGFSVTLYKVVGGNFDTTKIDPEDF